MYMYLIKGIWTSTRYKVKESSVVYNFQDRLITLVAEIKKRYSSHPDIANLNNLKVPQVLGGEIDAIIGIQYANTYPELVFSLPNGLQIFKSKFKAPRENKLLCVGGPLGLVWWII